MDYLGEVLESSTTKFSAQARQLDAAPDFGSLVKANCGGLEIYAVVSGALTGSLEQNRRPGAYGLTREQLAQEQPQIFELLKTDFTCISVGYARDKHYYAYLPPRPAPVHTFVYPCDTTEIRMVVANFNFLRSLCANPDPGDELVAAALRYAAAQFPEPQSYLVEAGRELLKILRDDYDRFGAIMARTK